MATISVIVQVGGSAARFVGQWSQYENPNARIKVDVCHPEAKPKDLCTLPSPPGSHSRQRSLSLVLLRGCDFLYNVLIQPIRRTLRQNKKLLVALSATR